MTHAKTLDRLVSELRERSDLCASEIDGMWRLYAHYYGGVNEEQFRSDLSRKTHVLLCFDGDRRICGFSTVEVCEHAFEGEKFGILFSGDTIVRHEYWARNDLAFRWIRFASQLKTQRLNETLYWLLIVKGHRTYRYLSAFGRRYFPAPDWPTPPGIQCLMHSLASARFGDAYKRNEGVIRFAATRGYLKPPWSTIPASARSRKDVSFFLQRNPGYEQGTELVCLCEVSRENMKPLAKRLYDDVAGQ